jgi:ubiquinone/menaquinone biosynthesis C-methylase UbiE
MLFEAYIPPGSAILDLGVGGGRTTSYLANRASRYVGVDYAAAMVETCQAKFPGLEFVVADAANLQAFPDASFDVVVFSFNGIDYVLPDESRRRCLGHIHRVLKAGGVMIFSSHNARAMLVFRRWNRERLQRIARRFSAGSRVSYWLLLEMLTSARAVLAFFQSAGATSLRALERIPTRTFWQGQGSLVDSVHGGLLTHYSIPSRVISELAALHFRPERIVGNEYPQATHLYTTGWYYYVFAKTLAK